jgi:ABC-type sugar transport system substrate-binding protein
MSHTTSLRAIVITDEKAIRAAVARLQRQGIPVSLLERVVPRAFFQNQKGMDTPADFVVRCDAARYDIGLYKENGAYDARTDLWQGHVASVFGNPTTSTDPAIRAAAAIGKFTQAYGIEAARADAVRRGLSVREVQDGAKVKLVLTGATL